ncbi:hypothetical protein AAFF_G00427670 [Aldrovandia affinis]|uniref:Uncharacterized protein n=1 Tax=Aldrovandia affinis TaxID=143900 RepID=A0AAD7SA23_9TELE|nr:hypothetical protein AAFF_G00427670 [Aldrovandia affinis]
MWRVWREVAAVYTLSTFLPCPSAYSSGECYFNTKANCEYRGEVFEMRDSWMTKDCYQCICMEPFDVGCCEQ